MTVLNHGPITTSLTLCDISFFVIAIIEMMKEYGRLEVRSCLAIGRVNVVRLSLMPAVHLFM